VRAWFWWAQEDAPTLPDWRHCRVGKALPCPPNPPLTTFFHYEARMKIKMPIRFFGNYQVIVRSGAAEAKERCQKLTILELSPEDPGQPPNDPADAWSYQIIFHDAGCRRIITGKLKENLEEKVVFLVEDKEYEFSPL
jgi:hypothetical protein